MEFKQIKLSGIEPGLVYKILCESYKGWQNFSKYEEDWKQFDQDIHNNPDGIGSSGFGTFRGEEFVGFISWDPTQFPSYVIIGHNCVLPKYRNQGIGKYQLGNALDRFEKMGFHNARVSTKDSNFFKHARQMYESCGFVEYKPYRDDGENMIYYSRIFSKY